MSFEIVFGAVVQAIRRNLIGDITNIPIPVSAEIVTTARLEEEPLRTRHRSKLASAESGAHPKRRLMASNYYRHDAVFNPIYRRNFDSTLVALYGSPIAIAALRDVDGILRARRRQELRLLLLDGYRTLETQREIRECYRRVVAAAGNGGGLDGPAAPAPPAGTWQAMLLAIVRREIWKVLGLPADRLRLTARQIEKYCDRYYSAVLGSVIDAAKPGTWFPHSTGFAFDVTLKTDQGGQIDMFCNCDELGPKAETAYFEKKGQGPRNVTELAAMRNRRRLYWTMQASHEGFWINYPNEFFHFEFLSRKYRTQMGLACLRKLMTERVENERKIVQALKRELGLPTDCDLCETDESRSLKEILKCRPNVGPAIVGT